MNVCRSAGFRVPAQRQKAQLVCAVKEVFVGKFSWLGHHDHAILQRRREPAMKISAFESGEIGPAPFPFPFPFALHGKSGFTAS